MDLRHLLNSGGQDPRMRMRNLIFPDLNNQDFNELAGGRRPGRRGDIMMLPGLNRWRIRQVPLDEPSVNFTTSWEARFEGSWNLPDAPPQHYDPVSERFVGPRANDPWFAQFEPYLDSFMAALRPVLNSQNASEIRVYLRHDDESIETIQNPEVRARGGAHFNTTATGMASLRRQLALALAEFVETYVEEDENFDTDLNLVRVRIDIAPRDGGGMLPLTFPQDLPKGLVWEPKGQGNCAFKCLEAATGHRWDTIKEALGLEDFCPYGDLMMEFAEKFPQYSVRLISCSGYLRHRVDGPRFQYTPSRTNEPGALSRQHYCIYLILDNRHYYLVKQIGLFIKKLKTPATEYCHGCCRIFPDRAAWQLHVCHDEMICNVCNMIFANTIQRVIATGNDLGQS